MRIYAEIKKGSSAGRSATPKTALESLRGGFESFCYIKMKSGAAIRGATRSIMTRTDNEGKEAYLRSIDETQQRIAMLPQTGVLKEQEWKKSTGSFRQFLVTKQAKSVK